MTLQLEEPGDRGERDFVVGQAELAPDVRARPPRIQERIRVHPAIDRQELLRDVRPRRPGLAWSWRRRR